MQCWRAAQVACGQMVASWMAMLEALGSVVLRMERALLTSVERRKQPVELILLVTVPWMVPVMTLLLLGRR